MTLQHQLTAGASMSALLMAPLRCILNPPAKKWISVKSTRSALRR
jgi:hypothetical protein